MNQKKKIIMNFPTYSVGIYGTPKCLSQEEVILQPVHCVQN